MNISIASYSFHGLLSQGRMDVFGYLESVKYRYHLNTADIWNGFLPTLAPDFIRKVKEELTRRDLTLVNIAVDGAHILEEDESLREKNYQNAMAHLRAAEELGAKSVRIDIGGGRTPDITDQQFEQVVQCYQEYAHIAKECGFRVGPENHWGCSLVPTVMERIARAVDDPAYGILLHVGRWSQDADRGDAMVVPWAMHLHVDGATVERDVEAKVKLLTEAGYKGYWGVEDGAGEHEHEQVMWTIAGVQRALARCCTYNSPTCITLKLGLQST